MKTNEGTIDRVLRVVFGIVILSLAFVGPQSAWAYIGIVPLVTGVVGWCPLYELMGINSCPAKRP